MGIVINERWKKCSILLWVGTGKLQEFRFPSATHNDWQTILQFFTSVAASPEKIFSYLTSLQNYNSQPIALFGCPNRPSGFVDKVKIKWLKLIKFPKYIASNQKYLATSPLLCPSGINLCNKLFSLTLLVVNVFLEKRDIY